MTIAVVKQQNKQTNKHFFPGQAWLAVNQYFVHILSLVTGNNPSCISGMAVEFFHDQSPRKYGIRQGLNLQPLDLLSNLLPTALPGPLELCLWFYIFSITVNAQKFLTLVACQKGLGKQRRSRSDCFWRSSLIRVFSVCYSDKHFLNYSPGSQHFIWEQKEKSNWNFRTFTVFCR